MEMTVSGELRQSGEHQYLVPRVTLKNIGNSKIALVQQGSGYRVSVAAEPSADVREAEWAKASKVYSIFENHHWIEPGESIFDEVRLIPLSRTSIAAKIEARLVAEVKRFPRRKTTEWNSAAIVGPVVSTKGACMEREHACKADQMPEDSERTTEWEREKDDEETLQREEDPERSKEWERDKKRPNG
jgi:hypothetical protein